MDTVSTTGSGNGNLVLMGMPPLVGPVYVRGWIQLVPTSAQGKTEIFSLAGREPSSNTILGVEVSMPSGSVSVGGLDTSGDVPDLTGLNFDAGVWHLVELAVAGAGTSDGGRRLALDGTIIASRSGLSWTGNNYSVAELIVGMPWQEDRRFTGVLHYDDVRLSGTPHASKFSMSVGPVVRAQECNPLSIQLQETWGGLPAIAPYQVDLSLAVTGISGQFYRNPTCSMPSSSQTIQAGDSSVVTWFWPDSPGTATLEATHTDFLTGALVVSINAPTPADGGIDGGSDAGAEDAGVDGGMDAGADDSGIDGGMDAGVDDGGIDGADGGGDPPDAGNQDHKLFSVGCGCGGSDPEIALGIFVWLFLLIARRQTRPGILSANHRGLGADRPLLESVIKTDHGTR